MKKMKINLIGLITVLSLFFIFTGKASAITADIKANSSDGPVSVSDSSVSLTINLDATGNRSEADWWLVYNDGSAWHYYNLSGTWQSGLTVTYQGALSNLGSTSFNLTGLSSGSYTFYFAVDLIKNGTVDTGSGQIFYDSVVVTVSGSSGISKIPDTGQTSSYTDTFGEDSDYTINPPSYTNNGNGTVTDNVTGLMWQQQDDDTKRIWSDAGPYCSSLTLAGYADWRLPTSLELILIINYGTSAPMIATTYFPGTNAEEGLNKDFYWSSTEFAGDASWAMSIYFQNGFFIETGKWKDGYARCVRGGQVVSAKNLTDNGNGTVTDNDSGLIWQQGVGSGSLEGGIATWDSALAYCEGLSLAGNNSWRLPNIKELSSLIDFTKNNPAIDTAYFPGIVLSSFNSNMYWSSTSQSGGEFGSAFPVNIDSGDLSILRMKSVGATPKCVSSG